VPVYPTNTPSARKFSISAGEARVKCTTQGSILDFLRSFGHEQRVAHWLHWRVGSNFGQHQPSGYSRKVAGWSALDVPTISSTYIGVDQFGHDRYDTKRSEMGELLYRLKYNQDTSVVPEIVETASSCVVKASKEPFDLIIPVPASLTESSSASRSNC
jgi:hypothetical protein